MKSTVQQELFSIIQGGVTISRIRFHVETLSNTVTYKTRNNKNALTSPIVKPYMGYLVEKEATVMDIDGGNRVFVDLGTIYKQIGAIDCLMCNGRGIVQEWEFDERIDVPCPCTIVEEDFSGSSEGDR